MTAQTHTAGDLARLDLLQYLRREPFKIVLVGPVSLWLRGGYSIRRTEALLEQLVCDGILREATKSELRAKGVTHGYYLAEGSREKLPPEDPTHGLR